MGKFLIFPLETPTFKRGFTLIYCYKDFDKVTCTKENRNSVISQQLQRKPSYN